jgi:hypothetical protein
MLNCLNAPDECYNAPATGQTGNKTSTPAQSETMTQAERIAFWTCLIDHTSDADLKALIVLIDQRAAARKAGTLTSEVNQ